MSVAPMMEWTDRHCRYLHRLLSARTRLYTEMVTADAVVHGDPERLLGFDPAEHPVAVQLGGGVPRALAEAARIAAGLGYDEINLNVGCPSDRVQAGTFGAVLMKTPSLVADCAAAMIEAAGGIEVTVKCRIGVDDQDPRKSLPAVLDAISGAGVKRVVIHARKAWLKGLSARDNREVPPLDYAVALDMKAAFEALEIVVNGGVASLDAVLELLARGFDGVMIGRAAYHDPVGILAAADRRVFGQATEDARAEGAVQAMLPYIERHLAHGGRLNQITRHMLGLFSGRPGARVWRRVLSEGAHLPGAGPELVERALAGVAARGGLREAANS